MQALFGRWFDQVHIEDKNPARSHNRTGPAAADRLPPRDFQSVAWKSLEDTRLIPRSIAVRPAELRPVRCQDRRRRQEREQNRGAECRRESTVKMRFNQE